MSDEPKYGLSLPQVIAGALAAASAAIASSWLGVAGTVIGAAVVSVVASIGSALYARPIERSHERLRAAATARGVAHRVPVGTGATSTMVLPTVEEDPPPSPLTEHDLGTSSVLDREAGGDGRRQLPGRLARRWRTVAVSALAMLVGGLVILTGLELIANGTSSVTGVGGDRKPTLVRLFDGGDDGSSGGGGKSPAPADTNRTSTEPTDSGPTSEPAETPEPTEPTSVEPNQTQPTDTAPTEQPTETQPTGTAPTSGAGTTQPAPTSATP